MLGRNVKLVWKGTISKGIYIIIRLFPMNWRSALDNGIPMNRREARIVDHCFSWTTLKQWCTILSSLLFIGMPASNRFASSIFSYKAGHPVGCL